MMLCFLAALAIWGTVTLFAAPIKWGARLALNLLLGIAALWLFNLVGVHMGMTLGVNMINAGLLAIFGPAGLVMALFLRWMGL